MCAMNILCVHYIFKKVWYLMKTAVIGSRNLSIENIGRYIPENTTELFSGGAKGVDTCVREYAKKHGIKLTEILPEYNKYGRAAPLKRNLEIIKNSDIVVVLWDGASRGSRFVINECKKVGREIKVHIITEKGEE